MINVVKACIQIRWKIFLELYTVTLRNPYYSLSKAFTNFTAILSNFNYYKLQKFI